MKFLKRILRPDKSPSGDAQQSRTLRRLDSIEAQIGYLRDAIGRVEGRQCKELNGAGLEDRSLRRREALRADRRGSADPLTELDEKRELDGGDEDE